MLELSTSSSDVKGVVAALRKRLQASFKAGARNVAEAVDRRVRDVTKRASSDIVDEVNSLGYEATPQGKAVIPLVSMAVVSLHSEVVELPDGVDIRLRGPLNEGVGSAGYVLGVLEYGTSQLPPLYVMDRVISPVVDDQDQLFKVFTSGVLKAMK